MNENKELTMQKIQKLVCNMVEKYNLKTTLEARYIDLTSELGEVGKEILKGNDYGKKEFQKTEDVELEIGDTLFSLICIANTLEIDLQESLLNTLEKYKNRFDQKGNIGSE